MYQRKAKTYRASGYEDGSAFNQVNFFKHAADLLADSGYEDAAFYFKQVEDHLRSGNSLPKEPKSISSMLGL